MLNVNCGEFSSNGMTVMLLKWKLSIITKLEKKIVTKKLDLVHPVGNSAKRVFGADGAKPEQAYPQLL
jgi:hypothetical protein